MKRFLLVLVAACGLLLSACEQSSTAPVTAEVLANQAYRENFGEPPVVQQGRAFARVGYLPLRSDPQRVGVVPFFLYSETGQLQKILARLIDSRIRLSASGALYRPFPPDLEIVALTRDAGLLTLSLRSQQDWSEVDQQAAARAFTETASQFGGVERLQLQLNGAPLKGLPAEGLQPAPQTHVPPAAPELVMIVEGKEKEDPAVPELLVNFDRPVRVNNVALFDSTGGKVAGDYFTSAFQMAVVVQPRGEQRYPAGTQFQVQWDVTDLLGRHGKGESRLPLQRYDH